jgi:glycosyltransferase involved in cell wall biosynthesis
MSHNTLKKHFLRKITFLINTENSSSTRYRVFNIIEGLLQRGIECSIDIEKNPDIFAQEYINKSDLLIVFRNEISENIRLIIKKFKEKNIPVVFDVDDLVFEPESAHLIDTINRFKSKKMKDEAISEICKLRETFEECDYLTCSTYTIAQRGKKAGKESFVVKNTINKGQYLLSENLLKNKSAKINKKIKIGYFSGSSSHQKDFEECSDALLEILSKYPDVELHIVGILDLDKKFSKFKDRIFRDPICTYLEMLEKLSKMDINIAPLELNNIFTDSKSELKIFEAALVEVPTVASSVDSYSRCTKDGVNGFLAGSKNEWVKKLALLIEDKNLRKTMQKTARKDFIEQFYINNTIDSTIEAYETIIADYYQKKGLNLDNSNIKDKIAPEEAFLKFCRQYGIEYTDYNLQNFDFVSLAQNPQLFTNLQFNSFLANADFKNKVSKFIESCKNKKVCFYGAGLIAKMFVASTDLSGLNILGFIDKNTAKRGSKIGNYEIFSISDLHSIKPDVIALSIFRNKNVLDDIKRIKKQNNFNFKIINLFDLNC